MGARRRRAPSLSGATVRLCAPACGLEGRGRDLTGRVLTDDNPQTFVVRIDGVEITYVLTPRQTALELLRGLNERYGHVGTSLAPETSQTLHRRLFGHELRAGCCRAAISVARPPVA